MQTNLRPMSLGEILDRTAQLYRTHFVLFAGIASVYAGALLVLNLARIGAQQLLIHLHKSGQLPWVTLGFVVLILPLVFISAGAAVAANNCAVSRVNLDQPATIRGAYRSILPRLGRYLWLTTIMAFFIYLPFILIFSAYFIYIYVVVRPRGIFLPGAQPDPQTALTFAIVTFVAFGLAFVAFVYGVLMALRYSLALPASVLEDLKAPIAIRRSIDLSQGSRGRIFVLGLLITFIQLGLVAISQAFFFVAMIAAVKRHGELPIWLQVTQQLVGFCTNTFIGPMYATGLTLFYYDQRIRKEGFDIERMMEAAGMTAPRPAQAQPTLEAQTAEPWHELAPESQPQLPAGEAAAHEGPNG
jgi:hypothetical protein